MNRQCKCTDCGYVFDYEDRTVVKESHGFNDGFYETFSCCPNCGGDFEDAADCCECGETFTENELYSGWCEKCLRETINYDTFFEYCEANKDEQYLDIFVMSELLGGMDCPKDSTVEFHSLMVEYYKREVKLDRDMESIIGRKTSLNFLDRCIRFIMDDDGSIGRENYADWLNKMGGEVMASIKIPIKVNLPDNWADIIVEKLKKDESICIPVIRCKNCKWFGKDGCAINIVDDTDKPTENDFCSFAELKEEQEVK